MSFGFGNLRGALDSPVRAAEARRHFRARAMRLDLIADAEVRPGSLLFFRLSLISIELSSLPDDRRAAADTTIVMNASASLFCVARVRILFQQIYRDQQCAVTLIEKRKHCCCCFLLCTALQKQTRLFDDAIFKEKWLAFEAGWRCIYKISVPALNTAGGTAKVKMKKKMCLLVDAFYSSFISATFCWKS